MNRKCPVCGHGKAEVLHTQTFSMPKQYNLPSSYDVLSCANCGFCYADTPATQEAYDRFYKKYSKYEDPKIATGNALDKWDRERLETIADTIAVQLDKEARILDVGCAGGGLLSLLKDRGYKDMHLFGLDLSASCVKQVNQRGFAGHKGGASSMWYAEEMFDIVILSHVLEHICDVGGAIDNLLTVLKPGGLLYLETPDSAHYHEHFKIPFNYFDGEHINHFDLASLANLSSTHKMKYILGAEKKISLGEEEGYPACYALFKKTDKKELLMACNSSRDSIVRHIKMSWQHNKFDKLAELAKSQEEIIVWGAGYFTQRILNGQLGQCNIVAFVDNDKNKHGLKLNGVKIYNPRACSLEELYRRLPVVICVGHYREAIAKEARILGVKHIVTI